jgi:hypothetical protein
MCTRNAKPSLKRVEYLDGWLVDELKERSRKGQGKLAAERLWLEHLAATIRV